MKLNLLNLLKANILKASADIAPAPESAIGKVGEFKRALADAQASPPSVVSAITKNVEPPVEESAVLISKRYSKSHVETQSDVKESVKFDSAVEKKTQVSPQIQAAPQTAHLIVATPALSVDVQTSKEVKHFTSASRVEDKAAAFATKRDTLNATVSNGLQDGIANGVVQQSVKCEDVSSPLVSRASKTSRHEMHTVVPSPSARIVTVAGAQSVQSSTSKIQADKRAESFACVKPNEHEVGVVEPRTSRDVKVKTANASREIVASETHEVAAVKQVSQATSRSETTELSERTPQEVVRVGQNAAKPAIDVRKVVAREKAPTSKDAWRGTIDAPLRRDTSSVEKVVLARGEASKETGIESPNQVNKQGNPVKVNSELFSTFTDSSRLVSPDSVKRLVPENNRPQVVQRIWSNETDYLHVESAPFERITASQKLKPPTLEANVLKQSTLGETKMNAALSHRVAKGGENFKQQKRVTERQVAPQQRELPIVTEPRVREQWVPISAPRIAPQVKVIEVPKVSKSPEVIGEARVSTKKGSTPVDLDSLQPLGWNDSTAKSSVHRQVISEPTIRREIRVDMKQPENKIQPVAVADATRNKPGVIPDSKSAQTQLRSPIAMLPELEFTKQSSLHSTVNERAQEKVQQDPIPVGIQLKPTSEARGESKADSGLPASNPLTASEDTATKVQTPPVTRNENAEAPKDASTSTRAFKPLTPPEPPTLATLTNSAHTAQVFENVAPRVDTNRTPDFTRSDRAPVAREEPTARSTQERPQQISESRANEQPNQHGEDAQTQSRERETGQSGFRQTIEQTTQTTTQTPTAKPNQQTQSIATEALKLALQKALDQSRKRMVDPDELRMSIPFGELGTMDIDIVREAEKFSIRIAADPQAIALMEDQRVQLTQWLRVQGYPVEKLDVVPRFDGEPKSNLPGSQQSSEERDSGQTGRSGRPSSGGGGVAEERGEAMARPAFSGLRVWTA